MIQGYLILAEVLGLWASTFATRRTANSYRNMEDHHIHRYLQLFTSSDKFFIKPSQLCCSSKEVLVIDRQSGEADVKNIDLVSVLGPEKDFKLIFGFLGSIKLISGLYLVVVTHRKLVGNLLGHAIEEVLSTEIIPYARSTSHLTQRQIEDNEKYEQMVRLMLDLPGAYFSYTYDLTRTCQDFHRLDTSQQFVSKLLFKRPDKRFVWNRHLLKNFSGEQFSRFTLPLIQGCILFKDILHIICPCVVSINHTQVNGVNLSWSLVSRRSVDRTGTRLFVRGIDAEGNVANHVVTEQIITVENKICSFVLTRGSVPLTWTQHPDLSLVPTPTVPKKNHTGAFFKHFRDEETRYGRIVCVNLISQHGKEGVLEEGYRTAVDNLSHCIRLKYRPFDFHAECGSLSYHKLDILVNSVSEELKESGYFLMQGPQVLRLQTGTFRVNCVDCLDRTNVVQSILAKLQLKTALEEFGVPINDSEDELTSDSMADFKHLVNNVWADHADMISLQYAGTNAVKTDFTRTGQRTYSGLVKDMFISTNRYYISNFTDGFKQDAFDVFLGKYTVPDGKYNRLPSPLRARHNWKYYSLPSVFLVAFSMISASLILPARYTVETLLCLVFWAGIAAATIVYTFKNSKEFVDWPKLRPTVTNLRLHQQ